MLHKIFSRLDQKFNFTKASAHCDIPCGIYDPIVAQINALTVIRMSDLISELADKKDLTVEEQAKLGRLVAQKEEHADKLKEEVRIIWGDYFKGPQFEQAPHVPELVHNIMVTGSKCRQNTDRDAARELLELVNKFAEAFWLTKGVETYRATCPYPPAETLVYPKLG
jgi:nickel superoxide dismutase